MADNKGYIMEYPEISYKSFMLSIKFLNDWNRVTRKHIDECAERAGWAKYESGDQLELF